ncbi:MAG TPA: hypothetical protein VGM62_14610 [Chthoniobacterales bacterium]|jgi:hypothetical protein
MISRLLAAALLLAACLAPTPASAYYYSGRYYRYRYHGHYYRYYNHNHYYRHRGGHPGYYRYW